MNNFKQCSSSHEEIADGDRAPPRFQLDFTKLSNKHKEKSKEKEGSFNQFTDVIAGKRKVESSLEEEGSKEDVTSSPCHQHESNPLKLDQRHCTSSLSSPFDENDEFDNVVSDNDPDELEHLCNLSFLLEQRSARIPLQMRVQEQLARCVEVLCMTRKKELAALYFSAWYRYTMRWEVSEKKGTRRSSSYGATTTTTSNGTALQFTNEAVLPDPPLVSFLASCCQTTSGFHRPSCTADDGDCLEGSASTSISHLSSISLSPSPSLMAGPQMNTPDGVVQNPEYRMVQLQYEVRVLREYLGESHQRIQQLLYQLFVAQDSAKLNLRQFVSEEAGEEGRKWGKDEGTTPFFKKSEEKFPSSLSLLLSGEKQVQKEKELRREEGGSRGQGVETEEWDLMRKRSNISVQRRERENPMFDVVDEQRFTKQEWSSLDNDDNASSHHCSTTHGDCKDLDEDAEVANIFLRRLPSPAPSTKSGPQNDDPFPLRPAQLVATLEGRRSLQRDEIEIVRPRYFSFQL